MFIIDKSEIVPLENGLKRLKGKRYENRKALIEKLKSMADEVSDIGVDYLIYDDEVMYCIERKTLGDLINSVVDSRLWMQLKRLKEMENDFEGKFIPILIVEGNKFVMKKIMKNRFSLEWLQGVILGVISLGVFVIQTETLSDTIKVLEKMNERISKKTKKIVVKRAKELNDIEDERIAMLIGVNGVGVKKAEKLLERFGSIKNIVNADKDKLIGVLGDKTGSHFYDVVNEEN